LGAIVTTSAQRPSCRRPSTEHSTHGPVTPQDSRAPNPLPQGADKIGLTTKAALAWGFAGEEFPCGSVDELCNSTPTTHTQDAAPSPLRSDLQRSANFSNAHPPRSSTAARHAMEILSVPVERPISHSGNSASHPGALSALLEIWVWSGSLRIGRCAMTAAHSSSTTPGHHDPRLGHRQSPEATAASVCARMVRQFGTATSHQTGYRACTDG
jgi:hypothetical protein